MPAPEAERPLTGALMATVETVSFEPGLYAVTIVAVRTPAADLGLTLPCIRIETLPPTAARPGRATVVDARDTGWLCQSEEPAYILVIGGSASTILTIYRARDGGPAPEIHITHIPTVAGKPAVAAAFGDSAVPPIEGGEVALGVFAHISDAGDVTEPVEGWIGRVGSGLPLEGFTLTPAAPLRPEDIDSWRQLVHAVVSGRQILWQPRHGIAATGLSRSAQQSGQRIRVRLCRSFHRRRSQRAAPQRGSVSSRRSAVRGHSDPYPSPSGHAANTDRTAQHATEAGGTAPQAWQSESQIGLESSSETIRIERGAGHAGRGEYIHRSDVGVP
jgi:hypothetical protein